MSNPELRVSEEDVSAVEPVIGGSSGVAESPVEAALPGEAAVARAARASLEGRTRGFPRIWPFLGPAFIAAVAYIDPGNFATNIAGGAKFGYLLLWVVLAANLIAMVVQTQSAKLGIATGKNLAEACRDTFSRRTSIGLWIQAEVVAAACDVAEVVGAALGLNLLFGIPLFPAGLLAGAGAFAILGLQQRGFRRLEAVIVGMVGVVVLAFAFEIFNSKADGAEVAKHLFTPGFAGTESILLATGIIGATVMPHVIYLHSALTQRPQPAGAASDSSLRENRRRHSDGPGRGGQSFDDDHGRWPVSQQRPCRNRQHRRCLRWPQATGVTGGRDRVRHRPARFRICLVLGRDDGRAGGDAGVHPPEDPDLRAPGDHSGACVDRPRHRP
jgi:hypothetical protein